MTTTDAPCTYSLREACALLGVPYSTGKKLIASKGQLVDGVPCFRIGRFWFMQRAAVDALLGIGETS